MKKSSPNTSIKPITATINSADHLSIGGCDCVELAEKFGTPLWIVDEATLTAAMTAYKEGLAGYPAESLILYASKAFNCLAMCSLLQREGLGIDVVSAGELLTALQTNFPPQRIYFHGNNKSAEEIHLVLKAGETRIIVDNLSELELVNEEARKLNQQANILLRIIPGIEPDTHEHIKTGHEDSKFGIALEQLDLALNIIKNNSAYLNLLGLHAHIGSQSQELEPFLQLIDVMAALYEQLYAAHRLSLPELNLGGGLGIAYLESDQPIPIFDWAFALASKVEATFKTKALPLPKLLIEPGRSIVGTAGTTLYRAGHKKSLPSGITYLCVDGGMADNPRPITYQAEYTACIANRLSAASREKPIILAGRFCESGDILIKKTFIDAQTGDLIAVFATGAYNYSMASNYNRNKRPACILVNEGEAEIIIEREEYEDLWRLDRVPERLK